MFSFFFLNYLPILLQVKHRAAQYNQCCALLELAVKNADASAVDLSIGISDLAPLLAYSLDSRSKL